MSTLMPIRAERAYSFCNNVANSAALARSSVLLNQRSKLGKTTADRSASSTRTAIISINVNPLRIELRVLFCHDIGIQSLAVWFSICSE